MSNYATKADFKNTTGVDTSSFAKKIDFTNLKSDLDKLGINKLKNVPINLNKLKSKLDKLDVDKLVPVPVDLSKIGDVVKNDIVKNTEYNKLVIKLNNISTTDTSNLDKKLTITQKLMKLKIK